MRKGIFSTTLLVVILIIGLSLVLYPPIADYWNSFRSSKVIVDYDENVNSLDSELCDEMLLAAGEYNEDIYKRGNGASLSTQQRKAYDSLLNLSGNGMMGYVEIPSIGVSLPLYHSTSEEVLQIAAGHMEWTSLPVGGKNTHSVITGHRGLPSAKLFTDLDRLSIGDLFAVRVLDEVIAYEVDQVLVVEPDELDALKIEKDMDYCTLVTCTPYGINSHRMLVRGRRTENSAIGKTVYVVSDAMQIEPVIVAPIVAAPMLLILLIWLLLPTGKKRKG